MVWRKLIPFAGLFLVQLFVSCQKEENVIIPNYLFANPNSLSLSVGRDTTLSLSGGVPPYMITGHPKANVATTDSIITTILIVHAVGLGSTSVKIGDSAVSQNIIVVPITVSTLSSIGKGDEHHNKK